MDSWLNRHLVLLASSAPSIDCVSIRERNKRKAKSPPAPFGEPNPKGMRHPRSSHCIKGAPPAVWRWPRFPTAGQEGHFTITICHGPGGPHIGFTGEVFEFVFCLSAGLAQRGRRRGLFAT